MTDGMPIKMFDLGTKHLKSWVRLGCGSADYFAGKRPHPALVSLVHSMPATLGQNRGFVPLAFSRPRQLSDKPTWA